MTPETSRTITINLAGRERRLWYNFAALAALGAKGPADETRLGELFTGAAQDFDITAQLVHAGTLWDKENPITRDELRAAIVAEWDMSDLISLIASFGALMHIGAVKPTEGEQRADPPSSPSLGTEPVQSAA